MPQYSIETSVIERSRQTKVVLRAVRPNRRVVENEQIINIEDVELLYGALAFQLSEYGNDNAFHEPLIFYFNHTDIQTAIETVISANQSVEDMKSDVQSHFFQRSFGTLYSDVLAVNVRHLKTMTFQYFDLLFSFEEDTQNPIIQMFRQHIDLYPEDDLTREYQFQGGTRKLVIPNIGNYKRINLPEDLTCNSSKCRVGKFYQSVKDMNELMAKIDWHCYQIAHKMKDHQETNIPNGPYWVI